MVAWPDELAGSGADLDRELLGVFRLAIRAFSHVLQVRHGSERSVCGFLHLEPVLRVARCS